MTRYLFLFPGLDPRQGGVQVSALDALAGAANRDISCIVHGEDPLHSCPIPAKSLSVKSKYLLGAQVMMRTSPAEIGVCWHLSMLKLLPFVRGFRGKVVVFLHGIEAWRPQSPSLVKRLANVDLFLSNSDYTWNEFIKYVPQVEHAPHITTPLGFGEPVATDNLPATHPSVLIVARMHRAEDYKGHRELILAWPRVLQAIPNARLDIVGEGDLRLDLEQLVKEKALADHVKFHGRVDEKTKADLLRQCRAFAMPSRGEGFGIVYLEAMRFGRPCLVSDCDAGREVVNPPEAGLKVSVSDADAMVKALTKLLSDDEYWVACSHAAQARYEKNFTVSAFQNRLFAAIDTVLDQQGSRR